LVLNSDLIEHIEVTPDTVISLTTGQKIVVLETAQEVVNRVVEFRRSILNGLVQPPGFLEKTAAARPANDQSNG
jgi:flagellar protein FlbD